MAATYGAGHQFALAAFARDASPPWVERQLAMLRAERQLLMTATKPLGIVLVFSALAAAVFWLLRDPGPAPTPVDQPAPRAAATASGADATASRAVPEVPVRASVADEREVCEITGRVIDDAGRPVTTAAVRVIAHTPDLEQKLKELVARGSGVRAELLGMAVPSAVAADGTFRVRAPPASHAVTVLVTGDGYVDTHREAEPTGTRRVALGDVTLNRGIGVRGRVTDAAGQGVAHVRVCQRFIDKSRRPGLLDLEGMLDFGALEDRSEPTDAAGRFELLLGKAGTFELSAADAEHPEARVEIQARALGDRIDDVELRLQPGAVIAGRVAGVPAGARLRVSAARKQKRQHPGLLDAIGALGGVPGRGERTVQVAPDGGFELRGLGAEVAYVLTVLEDQGAAGEQGSGQSCSDPANVTAPAAGVTLGYKAALVVTLRVVDATTQAPLTRAHIDAAFTRATSFLGMKSTTTTVAAKRDCEAADGRFTLRLRPGPKDEQLGVTLLAAGYRTHRHPPVALEDQARVDLGVIPLTPAPVLRVRVLASDTRAPLPGATVELLARVVETAGRSETDREFDRPIIALAGDGEDLERIAIAKTDADGRCSLTIGRTEGAEVRALAPGRAPGRSALSALPPSGDVDREIALTAGGTVTVLVRDARDRPVPGVPVEHRSGSDVAVVVGGEDGRATFAQLPPGVHRFRIREKEPDLMDAVVKLEPQAADFDSVTLGEGEARELVLVQPARAAVYGTVTRRAVPVASAVVALAPVRAAAQNLARDLAGRFGAALFGSRPDRTDARGRYRLEGVAVGEYRLTVTVPDQAAPTSVPVTVGEGGTRCDVEITSATLAGIVVDEAGNGIARARVRVTGSDSGSVLADAVAGVLGSAETTTSLVTDGAGRFQFEAVPAGVPLVVTAETRTCYPATSAPVTLAADGAERGVRIVLRPGGALRVRIEGEGLDMVVAGRIGEDKDKDKDVRAVLARNHVAELQALAPGRWRVRAVQDKTAAAATATIEVEVVAGKTTEVTLGR